jgi:hypothetical protein
MLLDVALRLNPVFRSLGWDRFCPRTASAAATSSRQSPYSEHRR